MFKTALKEIETEIELDRGNFGEVLTTTFTGDQVAWVMALDFVDQWHGDTRDLLNTSDAFTAHDERRDFMLAEYRMLGGGHDKDKRYVAETIAGYLRAIDAIKVLGAPGIPLLNSVTAR